VAVKCNLPNHECPNCSGSVVAMVRLEDLYLPYNLANEERKARVTRIYCEACEEEFFGEVDLKLKNDRSKPWAFHTGDFEHHGYCDRCGKQLLRGDSRAFNGSLYLCGLCIGVLPHLKGGKL